MTQSFPIETVRKPHFLKEEERFCFDLLLKAVGSDCYIIPKVRVADIFETSSQKENQEFWAKFDHFGQKHVDFLICKKSDSSPFAVLLLKGESHHEILSDNEFIIEIFSKANNGILTISLAEMHGDKTDSDIEALKNRILQLHQFSDEQ